MTSLLQDYGKARLKKVEDKMEIIGNEEYILDGKVVGLLKDMREFKVLSKLFDNNDIYKKMISEVIKAKESGYEYKVSYARDYVTYTPNNK